MAADFRDATGVLFDSIKHEELATALGISVASIRQARLDPSAKAHRAPPQDWERAVTKLANQRVGELTRLLARLKA